MTSIRTSMTLGFLAILGPLTNAYAADIIVPEPPLLDLPEIIDESVDKPLEVVSGWYIRGDVSGNIMNSNRLFASGGRGAVLNEMDYKNTASYGLGVGYQLTDYLRVDATTDFSSRSLEAKPAYEMNCLGPVTTCSGEFKSKAAVWELMANAYVDLPTTWGLTPYIGAGLGVAHVSYKSSNLKTSCGIGTSCDVGLYGSDTWRPAWALMVGAAIPVSDYVSLDIGYRYSEIGQGKAFGTTDGSQRDQGNSKHEFRAGVRVQTW